jgi:hypothetical protein
LLTSEEAVSSTFCDVLFIFMRPASSLPFIIYRFKNSLLSNF